MKSFFLRVFPWATIFGFVFLSVCFLSAALTNDVTVGSHIDISVDDIKTPSITAFEKKPSLSLSVPVNGKDKSHSLRVTQKGNQFKDGSRTNITGELRGRLPLSPPSYPLSVLPKAKGQKYTPILLDRLLNVVPPQILTPLIMGEAGDILCVTGMYFSTKKPKVWIEYDQAGKEQKLPCKLTGNYIYPDAKGKLKSCMDVISGESSCEFSVNKKLPLGQHGVLYLANQIGVATAPFNVPGPQLTIVAVPASGGTTLPAIGSHMVVSNRPTRIRAIANETYYFSEWRAPADVIIANRLDSETTIIINQDTTITAAFEQIAVTNNLLELVCIPTGRGIVDPTVGNYQITTGTTFKVSAYSKPGFTFDRWYPGANTTVADQYSASTTVTLTGDGYLNAYFETNRFTQVSLTVTTNGLGSTTPTPGNYTYRIGNKITLSATPSEGHQFDQWTGSGGVHFANSAMPSTEIVISNNAIVTAHFIPISTTQNLLRINLMGPGSTDPLPGTVMVPAGEQLQLSATADPAAHFVRWTADGPVTFSDASAPITLVSLTDSAAVIAHFAQDSNNTVNCSIDVNPAEGGTTTPAPGTNVVYLNEEFEIEAIPAEGYYFSGWVNGSNVFIADVASASTTVTPLSDGSLTALFRPASSNITFAGVQLTYASATNSVHLAWSEAVDETTPASAMQYNVYAALTNQPELIYIPQNLVTTLTSVTSADITGLRAGTDYSFLVVPENKHGARQVEDDVTSVKTMARPMELVAPVKIVEDIVTGPIKDVYNGCVFSGDYRAYFQTGDFVYITAPDNPSGYPGRITEIYYSTYYNRTTLKTESITLQEVISEGNVNTRCVLTGLREVPDQQTNSLPISALPGPLMAQYTSLTEQGTKVYAHPEGEFIMWEVAKASSGDSELKHSIDFGYGVSYDYSLTFEPSLDYDIRWTSRWGPDRLEYAKMVLGGSMILELQGNFSLSGSVSFVATRSGFLQKTIAFKYLVGGVPVYQEIELSLNATCAANASAIFGSTATAKVQKNIALGLEWDRTAGWKTIAKEGADSDFKLIFTNNVDFSSYVSIYPRITTKFYKTASLHADIMPAFALDADAGLSPEPFGVYFEKFNIYYETRGAVGASFDMFTKTLASYETNNLILSDRYYFYSQPAVSNMPPTPTEPIDIDLGSATIAIGIKDGANNIIDPGGDGITWNVYDAWQHTDIVSDANRRLEIQWPAGVAAGGEGKNYYYVKMIGDGFLGNAGAYFHDGWIGIKDNSPMVTIGDKALETELRNKMSFPYNNFISVYKMMWLPTSLDLINKGIANVSGLEAADGVSRLYLQNNSITDFSPLGGMASLYELDASNNGMTSCSSCSGLTVTKLILSGNNLSSVEPLVGTVPNLNWLDIRANPLTRDTISNDVTRIRQQGVYVLYDDL